MTSARDSGEEIFTFDGILWNNLGHQIVGDVIQVHLLEYEPLLFKGHASARPLPQAALNQAVSVLVISVNLNE